MLLNIYLSAVIALQIIICCSGVSFIETVSSDAECLEHLEHLKDDFTSASNIGLAMKRSFWSCAKQIVIQAQSKKGVDWTSFRNEHDLIGKHPTHANIS